MHKKRLIFLLMFMFNKVNYGQSSSSKLESGDTNFDVRLEYFQHLDSAFAVTNHLAEVIMYEANYDNGKLIYNEPIVKYRFDAQGRRIYIEQNYWTSIGFTSRYTTYYKDSLVNVQHEKYTYTDGNKRDSKYVFKFIQLNDSLSISSEYFYEFDSLIRSNNKGIINSFSENRNKLAEQNKAAILPTQINLSQDEITYFEPHTGFSRELFYDHELKPEIVKDENGRIIEVHISRLVYNKSQNSNVFPVKSIYVSYQDKPSNIANITCYLHWDIKLNEQFIKSIGVNENLPNYNKCFSDNCIIYTFKASNFDAGIPKLIEVKSGKEKILQQRYICEIKKYKMKFFSLIFLFAFLFPAISLAQNNICINKLDSNKVKRIAKRHNAYWTKAWQCKPFIEFKAESCEWKVSSCKIKITHKGDCKNTNGCTITTQVTLLIDATSGKVKDRIELKHVTRNYE